MSRVRRATVYREQTGGMADTTTVKVHTSTRDLLLELGASRRESADQVIRAALAALQREDRRRVAAAEARAIKDDPEDRRDCGDPAGPGRAACGVTRGEIYRL